MLHATLFQLRRYERYYNGFILFYLPFVLDMSDYSEWIPVVRLSHPVSTELSQHEIPNGVEPLENWSARVS